MSRSIWMAACMGFTKQEAGWYTRDGIGGIAKEVDAKWYFYPCNEAEPIAGPFYSLVHALQFVRQLSERGE